LHEGKTTTITNHKSNSCSYQKTTVTAKKSSDKPVAVDVSHKGITTKKGKNKKG